jgi:predicted nucleotidyltransferase
MTKLSKRTKKELEKLGVGVVYLFGSQAQKVALERSDFDIGLVFFNFKQAFKRELGLYSKVYEVLTGDFPDKIEGPRLDISFLQRANPALAMAALQYGRIIFEKDPKFRADFEEQALKNYINYLPIKRAYEEANLRAFDQSSNV